MRIIMCCGLGDACSYSTRPYRRWPHISPTIIPTDRAAPPGASHHPTVPHRPLCSPPALRALPALRVPHRRSPELENVRRRSGAVPAPVRCRTHAYTGTDKPRTRTADLLRSLLYLFSLKDAVEVEAVVSVAPSQHLSVLRGEPSHLHPDTGGHNCG
ncbi:hypothetical protein DPEC_G00324140 [Dallia pectoralis]|uniref:Uncharacterized protein n=1 Tax=Dallia pectoralis TaxID=75939 RepID=A0ACC2FAW1_DALPE|nr:hypothetical protein DPEC_G00324140 [Dallia pectoralis]